MLNTINENRIIDILERSNKWWKGKFELEFKQREVYEEVKKFMHTKQIISLTGLRRTGKTTIMFKIIQDHISKLDVKNIFYFSFDEFGDIKLIDIIKIYTRLMNKDINKENYLFLFDEIQKIENWEEQLKRLYDTYPNIKFIISGSESLFIRKMTRESLAGRMYEFKIRPLNFREYLLFKNKEFNNLILYKEEILKEFNKYLICNGFPEIINENKEVIEKYIKDNVIDKIIYKDIPQIVSIKEPAILGQIYTIILNDPGEIVNIESLAKELKISRQTISLYLDYLEKSFLIKKLYNFSKNIRKTQRGLKKYYPSIIIPELIEKRELFGKVFENSLVLQLNAEFFWRDMYKNEVDIVIVNKTIMPIEIKLSKTDYKPLKAFMNKFKVDKGIILTYETKEKIKFNDKEIESIPFYEFLIKQ